LFGGVVPAAMESKCGGGMGVKDKFACGTQKTIKTGKKGGRGGGVIVVW